MGTQTNSTKTAHVMNLLGQGTTDRILPARPDGTQLRDIEVITREILDAKRTGGEAILTIGRGLMEAKAQLSHGEWLPWLEDRVEISERVAQNFMRLSRNYSNPNTLSDLGASKALMLLAIPETERDEFISEPHLVNGEEKNVIDMSARELQAALKERDAALLAAEQAKADRKAADEAREKMARDMAVANERIAGLNAEVAEHSARAKEAQDAAAEAQDAAARLEKELKELRSRPVDVAVETDTAAIEAARKEAEAAMQGKLDKKKKAQAKAEEARKAAEKAKAEAQQELDRVKAEAQADLERAKAETQAVREQAEAAAKKAALTSNEDLVLFRAIFDQVQELVNKLGGVLMKIRNKKPEAAKGLERALIALADKIREVAVQ